MPNIESTLLFKWFNEVWNNGDESAIEKLFDENGIAHGITASDSPPGPEGFKTFYKSFNEQFSNVRVQVIEAVREDDFETAHCQVNAVERKSGKKVAFSGMCMARIHNGKIAEAWNNFDFLEMHQQLGYTLVSP